MLYLLQGIDGKYARFAKKSRFEKQKQVNPYLVDEQMQRPGARVDKGKHKALEVLADDEEIRGIDFIDPDGEVGAMGTKRGLDELIPSFGNSHTMSHLRFR